LANQVLRRDGVLFEFRTSRREAEGHLIGEVAFLELVRQDPQVVELFETFGDLSDAANCFAARGESLANVVGLRSQQELLTALISSTRSDCFAEQYDEYTGAVAAFPWDRLHAVNEFVADAILLCCAPWRLPWPWLPFGLYSMFQREILGTMFGVPGPPLGEPHLHHEAAPHTELHFVTHDDEPVDQALRRRRALHQEAVMRLTTTSSNWRRGPVVNSARICRDVGWFYRRKIKSPPDKISSLAREYQAGAHRTDTRQTVKAGIARAERLLDVDVHVYLSPP
jgi:hypothetical protein